MAGFSRALVLVGLTLLSNGARSDVLYWLIDQTATPAEDQVPFQFVQMMSDTASGTSVYSDEGGAEWFVSTDGLKTDESHSVLDGSSATSFYFALYDGDSALVAKSAVFTFEEVASNIYKESMHIPQPLVVSAFAVVPEPTGGVLVLLGVAALALRRRGKRILKKN